MARPFVHKSAFVDEGVTLEDDVMIWHFCHVRKGAILKQGVSIAKDVYIDSDVTLGEGSRVQNGVSVYKGVDVGPWCFVGPHVIFTNDRFPRAGNQSWAVVPTHLKWGSSIGAGAIIRCGVTLGDFAMIGAGAIVTESVQNHNLSVGFPAVPTKLVCACGQTQADLGESKKHLIDGKFIIECCHRNLNPRVLSRTNSMGRTK